MKIVLATPLYPPDIAEPAPYTKELARRLKDEHRVTILTYGRLPERIPGVEIITIDKRRPLLTRLMQYARALRHAAKNADIVYAQNGPSVELPIVFTPGRKIFHIADLRAHEYASRHIFRRTLEWLASRNSKILTEMPLQKPEILPLEPRPDAALAAWDAAWTRHIESLEAVFKTYGF